MERSLYRKLAEQILRETGVSEDKLEHFTDAMLENPELIRKLDETVAEYRAKGLSEEQLATIL